eukprot:gene34471-41733_t
MRVLSVLTWNIWFDFFQQAARYGGIVGIIGSLRPDVVCLQEVTTSFIRILKNSSLPSMYSISDDLTGESVLPYGTLTMVRKELHATFAFVDFPSWMNRRLLTAEIPHSNGNVIVGNVHLESLDNHPTREAQLQICQKVFLPYSFYVLVGDFNFCSYRNFIRDNSVLENDSLQRILPGSHDMWLDFHDPAVNPGHTFDGKHNPLVRHKEEIMRYDRIIYYDRGNAAKQWKAQSIEIIGNFPLSDNGSERTVFRPGVPPIRPRKAFQHDEQTLVYPSDHFGLYGRFAIDGKL